MLTVRHRATKVAMQWLMPVKVAMNNSIKLQIVTLNHLGFHLVPLLLQSDLYLEFENGICEVMSATAPNPGRAAKSSNLVHGINLFHKDT
jgi:hypothetical protein